MYHIRINFNVENVQAIDLSFVLLTYFVTQLIYRLGFFIYYTKPLKEAFELIDEDFVNSLQNIL